MARVSPDLPPLPPPEVALISSLKKNGSLSNVVKQHKDEAQKKGAEVFGMTIGKLVAVILSVDEQRYDLGPLRSQELVPHAGSP